MNNNGWKSARGLCSGNAGRLPHVSLRAPPRVAVYAGSVRLAGSPPSASGSSGRGELHGGKRWEEDDAATPRTGGA